MKSARVPSSLAGFTLVEALVALMFLGILMPAVHSALILCNRVSVTAERTALATQLAENQLQLMIVDGTWNTGATRGDFAGDWKDYRWELTKRDWAAGAGLSELTVTVSFSVQGQARSVAITTLASPDTSLPNAPTTL